MEGSVAGVGVGASRVCAGGKTRALSARFQVCFAWREALDFSASLEMTERSARNDRWWVLELTGGGRSDGVRELSWVIGSWCQAGGFRFLGFARNDRVERSK